jgi:phytanoyl-CoA hydroxylase
MSTATRVNVDQFRRDGYVVAEGLLNSALDLDPVVEEYNAVLDRLARQWHAEGRINSTHARLPFGERLLRIVAASGIRYHQHLEIALPSRGVTEETPIHLGPAIFGLLTSPRLADAVEDLIGPEILSNPIQHIRIKLPERIVPADQRNALTAQTEWHQDQGVSLPEADETDLLTVWIPVTEATPQNGCLRVVAGSHRRGLMTHCPVVREVGSVIRIPDEMVGPEWATLPMRPGDVLFMHRLTMHGSLPNRSDGIRWSFDLRYQPAGQPTGRPNYPDFVVRSRRHPERALTDWHTWERMWHETRSRLAKEGPFKFHRWTGEEEVCA